MNMRLTYDLIFVWYPHYQTNLGGNYPHLITGQVLGCEYCYKTIQMYPTAQDRCLDHPGAEVSCS